MNIQRKGLTVGLLGVSCVLSITTIANDTAPIIDATASNPAPTYLLIVGDNGQVPSFDNGSHLSDMYYCEFDGGGIFIQKCIMVDFPQQILEKLKLKLIRL